MKSKRCKNYLQNASKTFYTARTFHKTLEISLLNIFLFWSSEFLHKTISILQSLLYLSYKMSHRRLFLQGLQLHRAPMKLEPRALLFHLCQYPTRRQIQLHQHLLQALLRTTQCNTTSSAIIISIASRPGFYSAFTVIIQTISTSRKSKSASTIITTLGKTATPDQKPSHPKQFKGSFMCQTA